MKYVLYTHTDYLDILTVHIDYLPFKENILIINNNDLNLENIFSKFEKIFFYDDSLPYASRVLSFLEEFNEEFFLFVHDMDIPLKINKDKMNKLINLMKQSNSIDRIDLQQDARIANVTDFSNYSIFDLEFYRKNIFIDSNAQETFLVKNDSLEHGIYNVNPSIWRKDIFKEILSTFKQHTYRTIEAPIVQQFCLKYNFYKLHSQNWINAGYFRVTDLFVFLHLTHGGELLPLINNNTDSEINDEYISIINKYNFNRKNKILLH